MKRRKEEEVLRSYMEFCCCQSTSSCFSLFFLSSSCGYGFICCYHHDVTSFSVLSKLLKWPLEGQERECDRGREEGQKKNKNISFRSRLSNVSNIWFCCVVDGQETSSSPYGPNNKETIDDFKKWLCTDPLSPLC
jgi:hypothetical protein